MSIYCARLLPTCDTYLLKVDSVFSSLTSDAGSIFTQATSLGTVFRISTSDTEVSYNPAAGSVFSDATSFGAGVATTVVCEYPNRPIIEQRADYSPQLQEATRLPSSRPRVAKPLPWPLTAPAF